MSVAVATADSIAATAIAPLSLDMIYYVYQQRLYRFVFNYGEEIA